MTGILITDFIIVLLIFLRLISTFIAAPIFNSTAFPVLPKLFLAFTISYIIFLTIDKSSIHVQVDLWWLFISAIKEMFTGLVIGFMLQFVFWGIQYAGGLIGFDMGLTMSSVFNPMDQSQSNVIGEALNIGAILIFFLIDGHHYIIRGLSYSFTVVAIGKFSFTKPLYELLIKYSASVFIIAIKIAAPIMVSFFLIHIGEGIMARIIPQMQVFFVTQPLKIGLGFALLAGITPLYVYVIKNLLQDYENSLFHLIKAMGS